MGCNHACDTINGYHKTGGGKLQFRGLPEYLETPSVGTNPLVAAEIFETIGWEHIFLTARARACSPIYKIIGCINPVAYQCCRQYHHPTYRCARVGLLTTTMRV